MSSISKLRPAAQGGIFNFFKALFARGQLGRTHGFARGTAGAPRSLDSLAQIVPSARGWRHRFCGLLHFAPVPASHLGQNGGATKSGLLPLARGRFTRVLPLPALPPIALRKANIINRRVDHCRINTILRRREPIVGQEAVSARRRKRRAVRNQWSQPRHGRLNQADCLSVKGVTTPKQRFDRAVGPVVARFFRATLPRRAKPSYEIERQQPAPRRCRLTAAPSAPPRRAVRGRQLARPPRAAAGFPSRIRACADRRRTGRAAPVPHNPSSAAAPPPNLRRR